MELKMSTRRVRLREVRYEQRMDVLCTEVGTIVFESLRWSWIETE